MASDFEATAGVVGERTSAIGRNNRVTCAMSPHPDTSGHPDIGRPGMTDNWAKLRK
jgi:hypothetical protein